jgi:hypothetical protein
MLDMKEVPRHLGKSLYKAEWSYGADSITVCSGV